MADAFGLRRLRSLPVQAGWRIPALSVLTTFLTPVFSIGLSAIFLGETLGLRHIAGMALIGLGLAAIDGRMWSALRKRGARG